MREILIAVLLTACTVEHPVYVVEPAVVVTGDGGYGGGKSSTTGETGGGGMSSSTTSTATTGSGGATTSSSTSSTATTGSGGATTSNSTSSTIEPPECVLADDCPGVDSECRQRTCIAGVCGVDLLPDGTMLAGQVEGDCARVVCDGAGASVSRYDDADLVPSASECAVTSCTQDGPVTTPRPTGTACTDEGGNLCKEGACVKFIPVLCKMPDGTIHVACDGTLQPGIIFDTGTCHGAAHEAKYCAPGEVCFVIGVPQEIGECI